jgi:hypothetical protein
MACRAVRRQEWRTFHWRRAPQCSKFKALVVSLFWHYVLFDRKNEV